MKILDSLYNNRFILFIVTLLAILFGYLIIPTKLFELIFVPVFFSANILAGILLISKKKKWRNIFVLLLIFTIVTYIAPSLASLNLNDTLQIRYLILLAFYGLVTIEIILQVANSSDVNRTVILGLMSGYICLGLVGFFIFNSIELSTPGSFSGIPTKEINPEESNQGLMYFSYITLLTIGYGDITPATNMSRNASMFLGMAGQFYLVILTAIVVGKFLYQSNKE